MRVVKKAIILNILSSSRRLHTHNSNKMEEISRVSGARLGIPSTSRKGPLLLTAADHLLQLWHDETLPQENGDIDFLKVSHISMSTSAESQCSPGSCWTIWYRLKIKLVNPCTCWRSYSQNASFHVSRRHVSFFKLICKRQQTWRKQKYFGCIRCVFGVLCRIFARGAVLWIFSNAMNI